MNKLLELREKRAKLWNDSKAFLDSHRDCEGCLSDDDEKVYEAMLASVVKIGKEIERLETQAHIDRDMLKETIEADKLADYGTGYFDGMCNAWEIAKRIVHLDWNGAYCTADYVEDWFDKLTPQETEKELEECDRLTKPHWKKDLVHMVFVCSACGEPMVRKTPFCPMCGVKMENVNEN